MTIKERNVRMILRNFATQLLDHLDDPEADVETMVKQVRAAADLARAELRYAEESGAGSSYAERRDDE